MHIAICARISLLYFITKRNIFHFNIKFISYCARIYCLIDQTHTQGIFCYIQINTISSQRNYKRKLLNKNLVYTRITFTYFIPFSCCCCFLFIYFTEYRPHLFVHYIFNTLNDERDEKDMENHLIGMAKCEKNKNPGGCHGNIRFIPKMRDELIYNNKKINSEKKIQLIFICSNKYSPPKYSHAHKNTMRKTDESTYSVWKNYLVYSLCDA